jgi:hypothetical protein
VCLLVTITAKLRYGTGKVDVALYELVSAIEAAQFRQGQSTGTAAAATASDLSSSPLPPPARSLASPAGRPPMPRPHMGPPKRGSHAD